MQTLEQAARAFVEAMRYCYIVAPATTMTADACARFEALRAALDAEAGRVSGWQPIETCPESCRGEYPRFVMFWNGHHRGVGFFYVSEDGDDKTMYVDETDEIITPKPTHWRPLPEPPTDVLAAAQEGS